MDETPYPLALADRAFAYDGAFRTPDAMSAAARAAYGMQTHPSTGGQQAFFHTLQRAIADPPAATIQCARGRPCAVAPRLPHAGVRDRGCVAGRDVDAAAIAAPAPVRPRACDRRPPSAYYLFISSAGCFVRAIVWRGRVFSGGMRTCLKSML